MRKLPFLIVFTFVLGCSPSHKSPERIVQELRTSAGHDLPIGSDRSTVIAFLDSHRIGHSPYMDANGNPHLAAAYGSNGRIDALIRDVKRGLLYRSSVSLVFLFDKEGKLVSYQIREVVTGP